MLVHEKRTSVVFVVQYNVRWAFHYRRFTTTSSEI